jgi:hypothetical protein
MKVRIWVGEFNLSLSRHVRIIFLPLLTHPPIFEGKTLRQERAISGKYDRMAADKPVP